MNRLWVRLTVLFSSVVLVAAGVLVILGFLITQEAVLRYLVNSVIDRPGALLDRLGRYYDETGSWDGVGDGINTNLAAVLDSDVPAYIRDLDGNEFELHQREPFQLPLAEEAFPIRVDNQIIGYFVLRYPAPDYNETVVQLSRIMVVIAFVGTCVGLVYAVFVSRNLTAPLTQLTAASRQIGKHNLTVRVQPYRTSTYEFVELANAFNAMAADLERGETLRRDMLADTAHELRTPLSVLIGNLRAILDDVYPLDKAEIARLYEQARVLSRLVNDLHELAQAEAKQLPMHFRTADVAELVNNTLLAFEAIADEQEVALVAHLPPSLPPVRVDIVRISQVIHNLLANALRHTPAGGTVSIRADADAQTVRIAVQDTGEGIAPQDLPHVFDRFYRADRARARSTGGAGLGLAIAKAIVETHGGTLHATSTLNEGATFTLTLPVAPPEIPPQV